jgi:hypothetical protein
VTLTEAAESQRKPKWEHTVKLMYPAQEHRPKPDSFQTICKECGRYIREVPREA